MLSPSKEPNVAARGSPKGSSPKGSPNHADLASSVGSGSAASRSSPVADFHAKTSNLALLASMRKTLPRNADAAPSHNAAHLSRFLEPAMGDDAAAAGVDDDERVARRDVSDDESSFLSESSHEAVFGSASGAGSESTEGTGLRRLDRAAMANYFENGAVTVPFFCVFVALCDVPLQLNHSVSVADTESSDQVHHEGGSARQRSKAEKSSSLSDSYGDDSAADSSSLSRTNTATDVAM